MQLKKRVELNNSGKIGIQEAVAGGIFVRKTAFHFEGDQFLCLK